MVRIVVNVHAGSPYLSTAFTDGTTPLEHVVRRVDAIAHRVEGASPPLLLFAGTETERHEAAFPSTWERTQTDDTRASAVYTHIDSVLDEKTEHILLVRVDAPFVSVALTEELIDLHHRSWCDYTFADGFPRGYAPEVFRRDILSVLAPLADAADQRWSEEVLFETLSRDINAFDIETIAAPEDYAILRTDMTVDTRPNYVLCRRLAEAVAVRGTDGDLIETPVADDPLLTTLIETPTVRRTLPRYYQIQITSSFLQRPAYLPWSETSSAGVDAGESGNTDESKETAISIENWKTLIAKIASVTPETVISLGYRGEPSLHPALPEIIAATAEYPGLSLYIETSGLGWNDAAIEALRNGVVAAVIVELDTDVPESYQRLRGDGLTEAHRFVDRLTKEIPDRVYVQATRMRDNEWELQDFYRHWNEKGVAVIIQKYNSFAGRLPDRRPADLTPLRRIPCRHLERDMVILLDGTVPRCMQDIDGVAIRGNAIVESLETVWDAGAAEYDAHIRGAYPDMCRMCDEYYTINQ